MRRVHLFEESVKERQPSITVSLYSKLNILMKTVNVIVNVIQVRAFKNRLNVINKTFPNFLRCSAIDCFGARI